MKGAWPPYLHGERGYVKMAIQLAKGILATVAAIKKVQPEARMVHVEATRIYRAAQPELEALAAESRLKGFLVYDLITGRITSEHPLYSWLVASGARLRELGDISSHAITVDVMGLNFYPQWSTQEMFLDAQDNVAARAVEQDGAGFGAMLEDYYRRYGVPIFVTETSARDSEAARSAWLKRSLDMIKGLRARGVPVLGYTWFPLFTMIEWDYRWGRGPLDNHLLDLGMYTLVRDGGPRRWRAFPIVDNFRSYISNPGASIGELAGL
jgi:beta-glucosidase/6-phospho-beta-glucosidase/beta-galactosidase